MRAAVFREAGKPLSIETLSDPTPQPDEVVVKVAHCGVCGTDLHMTEGHSVCYPAGMVPGHEVAGEVVAAGRAVEGVKVGDRITAASIFGCGTCQTCLAGDPFGCPVFQSNPSQHGLSGGFGEYTVAKARTCLVLPQTLSLADGALVEPLACSLHGFTAADMKPGARVLILGAGASGLGVLFWARRMGAGRIAVAARSNRGQELAMALGADAFLTSEEDRAGQVQAALGGAPDIVFECVGRPGLINEAIMLVRFRGTVVVQSMCVQPDGVFPVIGTMKEVRLRFAISFNIGEFEHSARALEKGAVEARAMVTGSVTLDELPQAFEGLRERSPHCKILVNPWS